MEVSHADGTNVWSFTMPAYDVEVTVAYKKAPETQTETDTGDDGSTTHTEKVTETTKDVDGKVTDTKTTTTESTATSTEHADGSVTDKEMVKTTETGADGYLYFLCKGTK